MDAKPNHDAEGMRIVERDQAREFCDAMCRLHGIEIVDLRSNPEPNHPPDCLAVREGKPFSIELAEPVDERLIGDLRRAGAGGVPLSGKERFDRAQWTQQRLEAGIEAIFSQKDARYSRRGLVVDALVIHTQENRLLPAYVESWLPTLKITPRKSFRNAYLLGRYRPDPEGEGNGGRPLYRLYGSQWS